MLECDTCSEIKKDIYNKNMDYSYNIKTYVLNLMIGKF